MGTLKVAIAEDEPLARERLSRMLHQAGCEIAGEFRSGSSLIQWLKKGHRPDALFLDIQMPGLSGLEVFAEIQDAPPTIFVTAFSEHAVRAFELAAVDYILKPVYEDRLQKSLERLQSRLVPRLSEVDLKPLTSGPERVPVKAGEGYVFLDLRRITHFEVIDNQVFAYSGGKKFETEWNALKEVEEALPASGLMRIQRHLLLRLEAVLGFRPLFGGRAAVRVAEGMDLEVSRTATREMRKRLGIE
ncbi:MAG: LytTR family DNA-binding domain-containing protein [Holophagaceae bacterium]